MDDESLLRIAGGFFVFADGIGNRHCRLSANNQKSRKELSQKSKESKQFQIFYRLALWQTPHKSTDAAISIYNPQGDNSPLESQGC